MKTNKTFLYLLLCFLIFFIVVRHNGGTANQNDDIKPEPKNPIVVPEPPVVPTPKPPAPPPEPPPKVLETNFIYDDYDKAIKLSKEFNRKTLIIFGADWCPYCVNLKNDSKNIRDLDKYIVLFVDTDKKQENQTIINRYKPRSLPTSVIIDTKENTVAQKIGYSKSAYSSWLKNY